MSTKDPGKANIQEQLAAYRARKKIENKQEVEKIRIFNFIFGLLSFGGKSVELSSKTAVPSNHVSSSADSTSSNNFDESKYVAENREEVNQIRKRHYDEAKKKINSETEVPDKTWETYTTTDWAILALKWIMWLIGYKIFIILEFGAVYFILSGFGLIWLNMHNRSRAPGEASAYSVFNPNCEAIDGTFTAEQFERELLHKMQSSSITSD